MVATPFHRLPPPYSHFNKALLKVICCVQGYTDCVLGGLDSSRPAINPGLDAWREETILRATGPSS